MEDSVGVGPTVGVIPNPPRQVGEFGFMIHAMSGVGSASLRLIIVNGRVVATGDESDDIIALEWSPMQPGASITEHGMLVMGSSSGPAMGTARLDSALAKTAMATIWNEDRISAVLRTRANYCGRDFERSGLAVERKGKRTIGLQDLCR